MKLVILDRDGVLNEDRLDYVKSPSELAIIPQAFEALALLRRQGFTCVIATNQSAIGRGIIDEPMLKHIHGILCDQLAQRGGRIEEIFYCPDHPDHATYRRKPAPGMLLEALAKYEAKAQDTPFIGDTAADMKAALAAGCARYLVMTGKGSEQMHSLAPELQPVTLCTDILDAARKIVDRWK